ncbi:hypothetical protein BCU68_12920 [Vibrio sp. 10N.286.49.B3]|uniref:helix-turn-helix domain-containing protein n=1 Tax=Vibrio sp. 10N.286.49.B3 TaxID=1880855 RepID=UPI000CC809E5|nr:helix-turn-helix domain-containing protein [Vibrio sp. 10N.286.49.B3]PMH43749.1 hypothetical protein BCU68_12920 [Vibrio sp. 10N.286.49.B3]
MLSCSTESIVPNIGQIVGRTQKNSDLAISTYNNLAPFIQYFEHKGWDWQTIATECELPSLTSDSTHRLVSESLMLFISKMAKLYDSNLGFNVASHVTVNDLPQCISTNIKNSHDLNTFINGLLPAVKMLSNHVSAWVEYIDGRYFICHKGYFSPSTSGQMHVEQYRTISLIRMLQSYIGDNWKPDIIWMNNNSTDKSKAFELFFPEPDIIQGNKSFGAISLPEGFFYQSALPQTEMPSWNLEKVIASYALLPQFTIRWFANLVNMSPRTIQRILDKQSTKFIDIRDKVRREHAIYLLTTQINKTIEDIAFACGYNDVANFNRAFKRWESMTAAQYRDRATH